MKARKILIHSLIFSPDGVSTAYLYNDIALKFQEYGYEVVVLTTTPHFNVVQSQLSKQPLKWKIWGLCKISNFNGIKVIHIPQKKFKSTALRLLGFIYWHIVSFVIALFQKDIDIILSPSPPLTIGLINIWLSRLKGCKVIYNVQEIYPDILKVKKGLIVKILKKIEQYVYNKSSAVTTIDEVFYNTIKDRFTDKTKLCIIPNFVDTQIYHPLYETASSLDSSMFPKIESLKLLYAGNIGYAQDWKPLISLAEKTKKYDIEYFVIGEGVMKPYLEKERERLDLRNIHVLPYQPRNLMPQIIAYSDVQFIFMNPEMEMQGFPSKVYTIMSCGKPLLICSGKNTPIVKFLERINCAKLVTEKDYSTKINIMVEWLMKLSKSDLQSLGNNGRITVEKSYTKEIVTASYISLADKLLK